MAKRAKAPLASLKKTAAFVASALEREFPGAKCALHYETPDQLLFATILSAQCTDERVNKVTPALFAKYPGAKELAKARLSDVEKLVGSVNFFRTKARNLVNTAKMIQEKFGGQLPRSIEELTELPGVGRKTANVVLGDAFGVRAGVVVDTHVKRLSNLIGLVEAQDPEEIERLLMDILPKEQWTNFSHWLILHGRKTCIARRPRCEACVIRSHCEFGRKAHL